MATQQPKTEPGAGGSSGGGHGGGYKRASRKGAPRRFSCDHPGCDKLYSRAEHLQRHQLNHNPREVYRCDVLGCDQKFVRADLLARHKKRHSSSYIPRNRTSSFGPGTDASSSVHQPQTQSPTVPQRPGFHQQSSHSSGPHDAAILLTPESNAAPTPTPLPNVPTSRMGGPSPWPASIDEMAAANMMRSKPSYYSREPVPIPDAPPMMPFTNVQFQSEEQLSRENFAVWLFDPQASYGDFSVANIPFLEGGLESTFNNNIAYDYESLTSRSQLDPTPPRQVEVADELLSEMRRQEILRWWQSFRRKQPKYEPRIINLATETGGDLPALNLEMMRDCLQEYWDHISPRVPIVHQPTFTCNRCSIFLLMVMVALGAAHLRSRDVTGDLTEYGGFADVIISSLRWEIVTAEEASPPVALWVAQALLLLEFYEKMYSSRRFHERAHIYHSATLTLLRRGSPLIGRAGSESPPEEERAASDPHQPHGVALDSRTWWVRWAETESMHRVVFVAFMLDIIHAAMFGHAADMAPHEIRLPLPCDDNLWTASSPDVVRNLDANLHMYGVKQVSFLDGLKSALHGKEVKTHSFGRMIIMSGLLSVGWHLSHRETHLKWLDLRTPSMDTQDNWQKILLKSFDDWKTSFDAASFDSMADTSGHRSGSNGPIQNAAVLYHLAHISLHVDIVDCQVYAGAKRLLGRKVSTRDYTNAVARMKGWANLPSTRHAVLHAFKLLHLVLVGPVPRKRASTGFASSMPAETISTQYSCRNEPDPHRPWIMYYAALSIWSFVCAVHGGPPRATKQGIGNAGTYRRVVAYLSKVAPLAELDERMAGTLLEGLPDLLDALQGSLSEAHSELLVEACDRLKVCKDTLAGTAT